MRRNPANLNWSLRVATCGLVARVYRAQEATATLSAWQTAAGFGGRRSYIQIKGIVLVLPFPKFWEQLSDFA
jgi:hypothetical protein